MGATISDLAHLATRTARTLHETGGSGSVNPYGTDGYNSITYKQSADGWLKQPNNTSNQCGDDGG
jgi:hypothetical protein